MSDLFSRLIDRIGELEANIGHLQRQINNVMREGRVLEVDAGSGMAIVDGFGGKSKPIPWLQRAGSIREWTPPTVGERVLMLSPNGDPGRALILPGGFSQAFPQNHSKLGEKRYDIGASNDTMSGTERIIEAQTIILRGTVKIEGSRVTHNDTNIGVDHVHKGVIPGPGHSGHPL